MNLRWSEGPSTRPSRDATSAAVHADRPRPCRDGRLKYPSHSSASRSGGGPASPSMSNVANIETSISFTWTRLNSCRTLRLAFRKIAPNHSHL